MKCTKCNIILTQTFLLHTMVQETSNVHCNYHIIVTYPCVQSSTVSPPLMSPAATLASTELTYSAVWPAVITADITQHVSITTSTPTLSSTHIHTHIHSSTLAHSSIPAHTPVHLHTLQYTYSHTPICVQHTERGPWILISERGPHFRGPAIFLY